MTQGQRCPACAAAASTHCFNVDGYDIGRCTECGSLFVECMPSPSEMAALYSRENYYELPPDSLRRIERENLRRLSTIRKYKAGGSLLDIGCGHGLLLGMAAGMGYRVCGIEPSPTNARLVEATGHEVFMDTLEAFAATHPGRQFDVLVCLDVIEHVTDPRAFLALARTLMAEEGVMVLSTPNYSGLVARMLGPRDPYMTPPGHVVFFSENGLRRLAESAGLEVGRRVCFGHLIDAEIHRAIQRFLPRPLKRLEAMLKPLVNLGFGALNLLGLGLEQEVYLTRPRTVRRSAQT